MALSASNTVLDRWPQTALDLVPAAIFIGTGANAALLRWNRSAAEMCGRTLHAGERLHGLLHCTSADGSPLSPEADPVAVALRNGSRVREMEAILEADQGPVPVALSIEPVMAPGGELAATLAVCHAITRWKEAVDVAQSSEARLQVALDAADVEAYDWDIPANWMRRSMSATRMLGLPRSEAGAPVDPFLDRVHPDDRRRVAQATRASVREGAPFDLEYRILTPDGRVRWVSDRARVLRLPSGLPARMVGARVDVTARRETEMALRAIEERLESALEAGGLGWWTLDLETCALAASGQCKRNHGLAADAELQLETGVIPSIDAEHRESLRLTLDEAIRSRAAFEIELPIRWPDDSRHWLLVRGRVIEPDCMVGVSMDVTEARRTERAFRESEARYRGIVETANEGIWTRDEGGRIRFVNQRMADLLGYTPEAMLGRLESDFVFREDVQASQARFERRRQGVAEQADVRFLHRDGHAIWTLMAARPTFDPSGRFTGTLDLFTDITDRRRAEEELIESDRRKEEFLAILGHELRGPLAPIITAAKLLEAQAPPDQKFQKATATILRQAMHLTSLVEDLLDVGRITSGKLRLEKCPVELNAVLHQAVEACTPLIDRRRHTLAVSIPDRPVFLEADERRIVQVLCNLLTNAAKFMPEGGHIELSTTVDEGTIAVRVRDQGVGIPTVMLARIFDPFVQAGAAADRSEGGLGIGLSLARALVEMHGGTIVASSAGPGTGSEFTVRLPATSEPFAST